MITSFAQFLEQLQAREAAILAKEEVKHGPTIGDMYEGLARELIERAIPEKLNLKLVDGFVVGVDGDYSQQTDAMLVMGTDGHRIPKTEKWAWPIKDVLAVFEVKKNLYAADLADSIKKMQSISLQQKRLLETNIPVDLGPAEHAFARVIGRLPEPDEDENLVTAEGEIFRTIAHEQLAPIRVVFGFQGYADEAGLRTAFLDALEAVPNGIAGPGVLPNLIICRQNAILKLNGYPFVSRRAESGEWDLFGSTGKAPFGLLLELIWTRLSNQFNALFPVDDSLQIESIAQLLTGTPSVKDGVRGWCLRAIELTKEQLADRTIEEWSPVAMTPDEMILFEIAMRRGGLKTDDNVLLDAATKHDVSITDLAARLVEERIFSWRPDGYASSIGLPIHKAATSDGRHWLSTNADLLNLWIREKYGQDDNEL